MLKLIIEYKQATKLFIEYLKSNKVDPNNFFSADIKYQIGYFIDFIEQQGLSVICDNSNYWIYYTKNDPKSIMKYRLNKGRVLRTDYKISKGVIELLKEAIPLIFKEINEPF